MPDLHTRLQAEIDRQLSIAERAEGWAPSPWQLAAGIADRVVDKYGTEVAHGLDGVATGQFLVMLGDPEAAIRRLRDEAALLARHAEQRFLPATAAQFGDGPWCLVCRGEGWPCRELKSLATRLGVSVYG